MVALAVTDEPFSNGGQEALRVALTAAAARIEKRYPSSKLAVITLFHSEGERIGAQLLADRGWRVYEHPGLLSEPPDDTLLCRFSHLLLLVAPGQQWTDTTVCRLVDAWRGRSFKFGDERPDDDAGALLPPPHVGPILHLDRSDWAIPTPGPWPWSGWMRRKRWQRAQYIEIPAREDRGCPAREDWGPRLGKKDALLRLDQANSDFQKVHPRWVKKRSVTLLTDAELSRVTDTGPSTSAFLSGLRGLFGRADDFAIRTKRFVTVFHWIVAAIAPVSVLAYELTQQFGKGVISGLGIYLFLATLVAAAVVTFAFQILRIQPRMIYARLVAEVCRIQLFLRLSDVRSRLETSTRRWRPHELTGVEPAMRWLDLQDHILPRDTLPEVGFVEQKWLSYDPVKMADPSQAFAATTWFAGAETKYRYKQSWLDFWQNTFYWGSLVLGLFVVVTAFRSGPTSGDLPIVLVVSVLPAVAGGFAILRERLSHQAFADNYARMSRVARNARANLWLIERALADPAIDAEKREILLGERRQLLEQYGREAVGEAIEWMLVQSKHPIDLTKQ